MAKTSLDPIKVPPKFTRSHLAKMLNCSTLTIRNREASGKYPVPDRQDNGYRVYDIASVFELQMITHNKIAIAPIISILFDMGYTDQEMVNPWLRNEQVAHRNKVHEHMNG